MASFSNSQPITGTASGRAYLDINTSYGQNGNGWNVNYDVAYRTRNGWNTSRNASGGGSNSWSNAGPWNTSATASFDVSIRNATFFVGVDANGNSGYNLNAVISLDFNSPYNTIDTSGSESLPRIALAPGISALTVDTIKPTTARLGAEINGFGNGTSATFNMYYRVSGVGSYINAGAQGDVGGFNYWNLTGLKPGKTYQYYTTCANNNGDTATSGVQTFKTLPVSGMIAVIKGLI